MKVEPLRSGVPITATHNTHQINKHGEHSSCERGVKAVGPVESPARSPDDSRSTWLVC